MKPMLKKLMPVAIILMISIAIAFANSPSPTSTQTVTAKADGELTIPKDYHSWPKYLSGIQRPDANPKQIREIYVNQVGYNTTQGNPFAEGTLFVMENYGVELDASGNPVLDASGQLQKDKLLKTFVMGKVKDGGKSVDPALATGDWVYSAYLASGEKAPDPTTGCRGCHLSQKEKDWVYRYDEFFQKKGK
jgi:hemoglobin